MSKKDEKIDNVLKRFPCMLSFANIPRNLHNVDIFRLIINSISRFHICCDLRSNYLIENLC